MATFTPSAALSNHKQTASQPRSRTQTQTPPPRPTTPLRPLSRSSLRSSYTPSQDPHSISTNPIALLEPAFAELSDSMADLEANFMHLQLMHESLARFSECFASFLYGLNMNAYCVDFTETPAAESFQRAKENPRFQQTQTAIDDGNPLFRRPARFDSAMDPDQTFLSTDTSFIENPPASSVKPSSNPPPSTPGRRVPSGTGGRGRGGTGIPTVGRGGTGQRGRAGGVSRGTIQGRGGALR